MEKVQSISNGTNSISYTLTRSRRKTVGIRITENGEVKVAAPLNIPDRQLKDIILKKLPWILRKQEELRKICEESRLENKFADGETFLYLGKEYTLRIAKGVLPEGVNLEEKLYRCCSGRDKSLCERTSIYTKCFKEFLC